MPAYGGEKYPRNMYGVRPDIYKHHCETYGDPAEFGYHDFIPMFKAERWDPDRWAALFKIPLSKPCPNKWQNTTPLPGFSYSYVARQESKTPEQIEGSVNAIVDGIVNVKCKNGVTLLSIGPKPDGTLPDSLVTVLSKLGDWMSVNAEALHGADCRVPCEAGTVRFTRKGPYLYAIALTEPTAPTVIPGVTPVQGSSIRMLGSDKNLGWHQEGANVVIKEIPDTLPGDYAWVFKIRVSDSAEETRHIPETE